MNIGNPVEYTVREIAEMVARLSGSESEIVYRPLPGRRPQAPLSRHKPGARGARLGAANPGPGRTKKDPGLVRQLLTVQSTLI